MSYNTLKTILGYIVSLLDRLTSSRFSSASLDRIYNYLPVDDRLSTSGQPTKSQLRAIADAGFERVINLAPHDVENSLRDEEKEVTNLGMRYSNIPVNFRNPHIKDFEEFCRQMEANNQPKTWVHCAANMRVSAFIYCYRVAKCGELDHIALDRLHTIWQPLGVWQKFIDQIVKQEREQL